MNAPPEANSQYSRASGAFRGVFAARRRASADATPSGRPPAVSSGYEAPGAARAAVALGALLGAVLILVSQFTALYHVHSAASSLPIETVGTGANHAWAGIPLALAAGALAYAVYRFGNRAALVGLLALGVATLLIALLSDLPPTHATGLVGSTATGYTRAISTRSAGLYMETLGAVVLLISGGVGLLMRAGSPAGGQAPARRTPQLGG
jgi:hypothetical protein